MTDEKPQTLTEVILKIVRDTWSTPLRGYPWRCDDGMCGADDCPRCHPGRKPTPNSDEAEEE